MKIKIRMVTGPVQEVDLPESVHTVDELKRFLASKEDYEVSSMKLCFKGTVLNDPTKTLEGVGIVDNDTLVVVGKRKVVGTQSTDTNGSRPVVVPSNLQESMRSSDVPVSAQTIANSSHQTPAQPASTSDPVLSNATNSTSVDDRSNISRPNNNSTTSNSARGDSDVDETQVQMIMGMGFDRQTVLRALRTSFNNVDLAIEYCLSGIPPDLEADVNAAFRTTNLLSSSTHHTSPPAESNGDASRRLLDALQQASSSPEPSELARHLADIPNFEQIRVLILSNSSMLSTVLQQLQSSNPTLARLIAENPQEFMQYLTNGLPGDATTRNDADVSSDDETPGTAENYDGRRLVLRVTPEDREPVQRLMALGGFTQEQAARAYLMSGRQEEYAAAILFEAMDQSGMEEFEED